MQDKLNLSVNGQEVQQADFNQVSKEAALADDLVLAELLRMVPYNGVISRGILPYNYHGNQFYPEVGTVSNGLASVTGGLCVNPFRAVIGSTAAGSDQFTNIRSATFVNSTHAFNDKTVTIAAQAGGVGTTRIDLVYATLFVDQDSTPVNRYVKDPTTASTTPPVLTSLAIYKQTYVTVSVASNGTTSATPTLSTLPSDPPGGYNIPLAYVSVANGFGASSVIPSSAIMEIAPILNHTIEHSIAPANKLNTAGSAFFTGKTKGSFFLPPSMNTKTERHIVFDGTIASGTVVDDSTNFNRRFIKSKVQVVSGNGLFSWVSTTAGAVPNGAGASLDFMSGTFDAISDPIIFMLTNANTSGAIPGGSSVSLRVDIATGQIYLSSTGTPGVSCFVWLEASSQITNL